MIDTPEPTVADLFREWKIVKAKLMYDIACLPDDHADAELDQLCDAARQRVDEIEGEVSRRRLGTVDEVTDDSVSTEEGAVSLIEAVRTGLAFMERDAKALEREAKTPA